MEMHQLQPKHKRPAKKRVGRGGKKGTYSGRGMKGQNSRAGNRKAPVVRELIKRYPKLRGYRRVKRQRKPQSVSLKTIVMNFSAGEVVSVESLLKKGLVHKEKSTVQKVKIIGSAELKTALNVAGCILSVGAKKAIEKSGGKIT